MTDLPILDLLPKIEEKHRSFQEATQLLAIVYPATLSNISSVTFSNENGTASNVDFNLLGLLTRFVEPNDTILGLFSKVQNFIGEFETSIYKPSFNSTYWYTFMSSVKNDIFIGGILAIDPDTLLKNGTTIQSLKKLQEVISMVSSAVDENFMNGSGCMSISKSPHDYNYSQYFKHDIPVIQKIGKEAINGNYLKSKRLWDEVNKIYPKATSIKSNLAMVDGVPTVEITIGEDIIQYADLKAMVDASQATIIQDIEELQADKQYQDLINDYDRLIKLYNIQLPKEKK